MNQEASFTFTTPLTVNVVEIKGEEHLFVEGDISTSDIDLVNDIMTKECQESMQKQIMERNMKLDLEHEAFRGENHEETEINKTKIPAGKLIDATVKEINRGEGQIVYSTRVKGEINRNHKDYRIIKGNLIEKYLDAFSVAFLPTEIKYEKKGDKTIRYLNDVILLNVALTGNPCNTKAQMTNIVSKSLDALEVYKKQKKSNPEIEKDLIVKNSDSLRGTGLAGSNKLNKEKTNSKMTDENGLKDLAELKSKSEMISESVAEHKALLKTLSETMKSMDEKLSAVTKENVDLKETVSKNAESISKITKALEQPLHKSPGVQKDDAAFKAKAESKDLSVDPLKVFS